MTKSDLLSQIKPTAGYVLIEPDEAQKQTVSGIYLPDSATGDKPQQGTVLAAGSDDVAVTLDGVPGGFDVGHRECGDARFRIALPLADELSVLLQVTHTAATNRSELDLAECVLLSDGAGGNHKCQTGSPDCGTAQPARERSANYMPCRHEHPASPKTRFVTRIGSYK